MMNIAIVSQYSYINVKKLQMKEEPNSIYTP